MVADEDLLALLGDEKSNQEEKLWDLLDLQVTPIFQPLLVSPFRLS